MEQLKGYRTVAFGVAVAAVGAWDSLSSMGVDLTPLIPEARRPLVMSVLGILVVALRFITTGAVGKKPAETE